MSVKGTREKVSEICKVASEVSVDDMKEYIKEVNRTDTIMPLIDPTGWRRSSEVLSANLLIARAFLMFRTTLEKALTGEPAGNYPHGYNGP